MFPAGPQPRPSPPSVPCRTSTTTIHAQCSLPDLNHNHPRPVEVRQGTLGVDGRGWGPAGNTGRGWLWLRSGREHWAWMVVVEVRQRPLCVEGRGWAGGGGEEEEEKEDEKEEDEEEEDEDEEEATDIKSNNPHLAGGEKHKIPINLGFSGSNSGGNFARREWPVAPEFQVQRHLDLAESHACRWIFGHGVCGRIVI